MNAKHPEERKVFKMINLAIARAPHQVLYCMERLREESGCKKVLVLDMFKTENMGNSITRVLEKTKWDRIIKLNYSVKTPFGIAKYISFLICIKILSFLNFKIGTLVVGHGDIVFAKLIADNIRDIQRLVVVGDGLDFSNYSKKAGRIEYPCNVGNKAKIIIKSLRLKFEAVYKYDEIFTYFKLNDNRLKPNNFEWTKSLINQEKVKIDKENIYFLGQPLLGFFDMNTVNKIFKSVFGSCSKSKVVYIPHRREPQEQIDILKKYGHVSVVDNNNGEIVELLFISKGIKPMHLASFMSNALFSLGRIYPSAKIDFYDFRNVPFADKFRGKSESIGRVYEFICNQIKTKEDKYVRSEISLVDLKQNHPFIEDRML